jgi:membrane-bound inhibitor of C-type lysozyme
MNARHVAALVAAISLVALPAFGQLELKGGTYLCDRGVEVPVSYINGADDAVAVLYLEGRLISLPIGPSASGARYAWPSDGSGYIWWTKGDAAMLLWHDGATSEEVTLYSECKLKP